MNVCRLLAAIVVVTSAAHARAEYRNTILDDSPVAYYRFEEPLGTNQTKDSSGSGLHSLHVTGATFGRPGVCGGNAVGFSGNGSILLGVDMNPNDARGNGGGDYTVESWVLTTSAETQIGQVFLSQQNSADFGRSNLWITFDRELGSYVGGGTTSSDVQPELGRWYHFVMTVDGSEDKVRFFVDGAAASVPQFAGVNGVESSDGKWVVGSHKSQAEQFFNGLLDEIAFYDYRLDDPDGNNDTSDSRIGAHYSACFATPGIPGDFNSDNLLTAIDIDLLTFAVRMDDQSDARMNLNGDGTINRLDRGFWISDLRRTFAGDANLDGEFNSSDLVLVFQAGQFEDNPIGNSTWATGDWNGDGDFTTLDVVEAFQSTNFGAGPRSASVVPEPNSLALAAFGITLLLGSRHRKSLNRRR